MESAVAIIGWASISLTLVTAYLLGWWYEKHYIISHPWDAALFEGRTKHIARLFALHWCMVPAFCLHAWWLSKIFLK